MLDLRHLDELFITSEQDHWCHSSRWIPCQLAYGDTVLTISYWICV